MRKNFAISLIAIGIILFAVGAFSMRAPGSSLEPVVDNTDKTPTPSLPAQTGLPAVVEAKRQAIYRAALTRDYDILAAQADSMFSYSFGEQVEGGFSAYLRTYEPSRTESVFDKIPRLLLSPYGQIENIYVWPQEFATTEEYFDYRIGITADGRWIYYIAGD